MLQRGKTRGSWELLKRLISTYLRPHKKPFIAAMLFMAVAAAMRGVFTHTLQLVIDGMIQRRGLVYMAWVCALIIGSFWLRSGMVCIRF